MSFTFSWSPLIADTLSARELLTTALNKTPKPPIIVDDIVVTELNLGSTPPDLEILEIGDLAEDRFRGVFRMRYAGEAQIRLSTKVEGNPLRTSLEGRRKGPGRGWTDPGCLAAHSGLTIPLVITLSEFRLSGFVILVFSRQKGLTIVFRNDPLESLKVSSTFDSIPFVREYLQRTIEERLRVLFMEDLPAILHRLSLKLWSEEYRELDDRLNLSGKEEEKAPNPLAEQDPWDRSAVDGYAEGGMPTFSADEPDVHATFSQKNLLRLATLANSQRTLSLFTPNIRDAVFRAWAGAPERSGTQSPAFAGHTHSLSSALRLQHPLSNLRSTSSAASADGSDPLSEPYSMPLSAPWSAESRPPLSRSSSYNNYIGRHRPGHKKRKNRVINLRKEEGDTKSDSSQANTATATPEPSVYPSSAPSIIYEEPRNAAIAEIGTSRPVSHAHVHFPAETSPTRPDRTTTEQAEEELKTAQEAPPAYTPPLIPLIIPSKLASALPSATRQTRNRPAAPVSTRSYYAPSISSAPSSSARPLFRSISADKLFPLGGSEVHSPIGAGSSGGILEQAWMQKMAREIARKVREEQARRPPGAVEAPPPAYAR